MKHKINRYKKIVLSVLLCITIVSLWGCKNDQEVDKYEGSYIFYIDSDENKLVNEKYTPKSSDTRESIDEMIKKLTDKTIPKDVIVNSYNLLDGIVTLDFSSEYLQLSKAKEVLIRAAIVLTLTQIESVDYVAFTVNDNPIIKSDGTLVGNMQATDFVDGYGSENKVVFTTKFVLYYANSDVSRLKEYVLMENYTGEGSKEEFIIRELIKGVDEKGYNNVLSPETQLINVMTRDNICYVNFGNNFLTEQTAVPPELVIYSIVNSLSELNYVHKVQICVNGESNIDYRGIKLENAFIRNLDHVETETKEGE